MTTSATGAWAEGVALAELEQNGLQLLERNYREKFGELDLIMREARTIVFVEVRYRRTTRWGDGLASITKTKKHRLIRAARSYLQRHPRLSHQACRFDVVAISGARDLPELHWVRNAFDAA